MIELSNLNPSTEVRTLDIRHPASGALLMSIDLLSTDADHPTEIKARQEARRLRNTVKKGQLDRNEIEQDSLDLLAACTKAWRGADGKPESVLWNGQPLPCTFANAKLLYENVRWIRREVDRFINDVSAFLESSSSDGVIG